jgi:hypothetical protein
MKFNDRHDNYGDQLIFKCLFDELSKYQPVHFYMSAPRFAETEALRFRKAFTSALTKRLFHGERSIILDSPGARFKPKYIPIVTLEKRLKKYTITMLWKLIGAEFRVTGISLDRSAVFKNYQHYSRIGVRDRASIDLLKENGIKSDFCPDLSLLRNPVRREKLVKSVIMSFRSETPDNRYATDHRTEVSQTIQKAASVLAHKNYHFSFYSQVLEDNDFNSDFSNIFGVGYLPNSIVNFDYEDYFADFGIVISNRLHVLLPAMSCGIIPIALIARGHTKIKSLFIAQGWGEYIIYTDEVFKLSDMLSKIENDFNNHRLSLYNSLVASQRDAQNHIKLLTE